MDLVFGIHQIGMPGREVVPCRRCSAGWISTRIGKKSIGLKRRDRVKISMTSLRHLLQHQTGASRMTLRYGLHTTLHTRTQIRRGPFFLIVVEVLVATSQKATVLLNNLFNNTK